MSRGPGAWQREILRTTAGVHTVTVRSVVLTRLPSPGRDAFAAARRGAKGLVLAQRLSACYAWSCRRCGVIQDTPDPRPCCAQVRPLLAVARPGRLLAHPAPVPAAAPAWVSVPAAPAAPPGLAVPTVGDLASLAAARLYARLEAGTIAVGPADVAALTRLAREAEREHHAGHSDEAWQLALREVLWAARSRLRDDWPSFVADLRSNEVLKGLWPRPGSGP